MSPRNRPSNRPAEVHWDSAASRLINLILALLDRPRSVEWLRGNVEGYGGEADTVRKRFDRDRGLVEELGLVVSEAPGVDADGDAELHYRIDRSASFLPGPDELSVTPRQWQVLAPAVQWVPNQSLAAPVRRAVQKLAAHTRSSADTEGGIDGVSARVPDAVDFTDADIRALNLALDRNLNLDFNYWPALTEEPRHRRLAPWGVAAVGGRLYLTGHDLDRDEQRTFRLSRIADLEVSATLSRHPAPPRPVADLVTEGLQASSTMVTARVRFTSDGAQELRALATGDGEELSVGPVDRRWLIRTAAAYAPDALVVAPPDLVTDVIAHLEAAVGTFSGATDTGEGAHDG